MEGLVVLIIKAIMFMGWRIIVCMKKLLNNFVIIIALFSCKSISADDETLEMLPLKRSHGYSTNDKKIIIYFVLIMVCRIFAFK